MSVHFEHFMENHYLEPKLGIWKGRIFVQNSALKVFLLASFGSRKKNKGMKRNGEKWRSKKRNEEKSIEMQKKKQGFVPYAILVFQIFWHKKLSMKQIGEIQQRKKDPLTLFSQGVKRTCKNNCPLKLFILNLENHDLEPKFGIWKGRLFVRKIAT